MNRVQKIAWLFVVTVSLGVVFSIAATSLLYVKVGMPRAWAGLAFLAVVGLGGLGPLVFRKNKGAVACDERDRIINRRAALAAFTIAYLFVGLACMLPFFVLGPDGSMSVTWLPMIFMGAGLMTFFVHSVAILVQYGRGGRNE